MIESENIETATGPTPGEILARQTVVNVRFVDGSNGTATLKLLRVSEFARVPDPFFDELGFIAHLCGADLEWLDRLHPASYTALVVEARRVNADFFLCFARRAEGLSMMPADFVDKLVVAGRMKAAQH